MNDHRHKLESGLAPVKGGSLTAAEILDLLAAVPEEDLWLASLQCEHTRRAYRRAVADFIRFYGIRSREQLRKVERAAVAGWHESMKDAGLRPRTIRVRLAALSSLFSHL